MDTKVDSAVILSGDENDREPSGGSIEISEEQVQEFLKTIQAEPSSASDHEGIILESPQSTAAPLAAELGLSTQEANEDWYQYRTKSDWSAPVPLSFIVRGFNAGLLPAEIKVRKSEVDREGAQELHTLSELATLDTGQPIGAAATISGVSPSRIVADLEKTSRAFNDWHKYVNDLSKSADGLYYGGIGGAINGFLSSTKIFAKLSIGFGLIGAGLGFVSLFAGGKDANEKILDAVEKLEGRVDQLERSMNAQFEQLKNELEWNAARIQIVNYLNPLNALRPLVSRYQEAVKVGNSTTIRDMEDRLLEYDRRVVWDSIIGIYSQVHGKDLHLNILEALYKSSYGHLSSLVQVGSSLLSYCVFGLMADAMIRRLQLIREAQDQGREVDESLMMEAASGADKLYLPINEDVSSEGARWSSQCVSEAKENIKLRMDNVILRNLHHGDHKGGAGFIRKSLHNYWPWFDWFVVVYDPVAGFDNHAWRGWDSHGWLRHHLASGGDINVVIKWVDRGTPVTNRSTTSTDLPDGKGRFEDFPSVFSMPIDVFFQFWKPPLTYPAMFWACRRYKGVFASCDNQARLFWRNGKSYTVAVYG